MRSCVFACASVCALPKNGAFKRSWSLAMGMTGSAWKMHIARSAEIEAKTHWTMWCDYFRGGFYSPKNRLFSVFMFSGFMFLALDSIASRVVVFDGVICIAAISKCLSSQSICHWWKQDNNQCLPSLIHINFFFVGIFFIFFFCCEQRREMNCFAIKEFMEYAKSVG